MDRTDQLQSHLGQMKTLFLNPIRLVTLLGLAVWVTVPRTAAQSPPTLGIQTYAGLSITGAVGAVYTVQYTTDLTEPTDWQGAGIVQLPSSPHLWVDTTAPASGRRFYRALEGPTNVVWIPPGTFTMGSPETDAGWSSYDGPQTVVTLTRGFFMGKYELSQGEYAEVMGSNPSYFRNGVAPSLGSSGGPVTDELRHPVESVSWYNATNYCGRLTEREIGAGRLPAGWLYRLPTEAEWEYACRAGTTTAFSFGNELRSGNGYVNFDGLYEYPPCGEQPYYCFNPSGTFLGRTTSVGSYVPNGWGLYDIHGNVFEMCLDWWSTSLPGGSVSDPQGPSTGSFRVIRGGGWGNGAYYSRSAHREYGFPGGRGTAVGFRVVLAPGQP